MPFGAKWQTARQISCRGTYTCYWHLIISFDLRRKNWNQKKQMLPCVIITCEVKDHDESSKILKAFFFLRGKKKNEFRFSWEKSLLQKTLDHIILSASHKCTVYFKVAGKLTGISLDSSASMYCICVYNTYMCSNLQVLSSKLVVTSPATTSCPLAEFGDISDKNCVKNSAL